MAQRSCHTTNSIYLPRLISKFLLYHQSIMAGPIVHTEPTFFSFLPLEGDALRKGTTPRYIGRGTGWDILTEGTGGGMSEWERKVRKRK